MKIVGIPAYLPQVILKFHPDETSFPENYNFNVKCTYYEGVYNYRGRNYKSIEYAFDYDESGAIGCFYCCCPTAKCLGYHKGDRERLVFLLDSDLNIQHVCFNAHGRGQSEWKRWIDCEKTSDSKLVAYVARASHAFYWNPGTKVRIFGFANDLCENGGRKKKTA